MSCNNCYEIRELDDIPPDCETGKGCYLPPLDARAARILGIMNDLKVMKDMPSAAVVRYHRTGESDYRIMRAVNLELERLKRDGG